MAGDTFGPESLKYIFSIWAFFIVIAMFVIFRQAIKTKSRAFFFEK